MAQPNYADEQHRLDNLLNMRFVRAYADVRHEVWANMDEPRLGHYLKGYMQSMEEELARELNLPQTTMVGRLVDFGNRHVDDKDAKDEAPRPAIGE